MIRIQDKLTALLIELFSGKASSGTYITLVVLVGGALWRTLGVSGGVARPLRLMTLREHQLRGRLSTVKEVLEDATDPAVRAALLSAQGRWQLQLVLGDGKPTLFRELEGVFQHVNATTSWNAVRAAAPHLRFDGDRVVPGLSWFVHVSGWMLTIAGAAAYGMCVLMFSTMLNVAPAQFFPSLAVVLVFMAPFAAVGELFLRAATPMMRARQLQRAVRRWRAAQDQADTLTTVAPGQPTALASTAQAQPGNPDSDRAMKAPAPDYAEPLGVAFSADTVV